MIENFMYKYSNTTVAVATELLMMQWISWKKKKKKKENENSKSNVTDH